MPTFAKACLEGKTVLITGGIGTIGRVVVRQLMEHSARVAINDIVTPKEARKIIQDSEEQADRVVCYLRADVTKSTNVQELIDRVKSILDWKV